MEFSLPPSTVLQQAAFWLLEHLLSRESAATMPVAMARTVKKVVNCILMVLVVGGFR